MIVLFCCSLIWAFSYGLIKGNLTTLSPDFVACMRMLIPLAISAFFFTRKLSLSKSLPWIGIGMIQYGLMYLFVIRAYAFLPAHHIVFFTAFTPLYVTLCYSIQQRSFSARFWIASLCALLAVCMLYLHALPSKEALHGFLLVQLSDLCFAFGQVSYITLRTRYNAYKDNSLYPLLFLGGFFITALITTLSNGWSSLSILSMKQSFLLIYLGAIASGLCFYLWNKTAVTTSPGILSVMNNSKIPLGIFVSIFCFHETGDALSLSFSLILMVLALAIAEFPKLLHCYKLLIKKPN